MRRELLKRVIACACLCAFLCVLVAGRLTGPAAAQGPDGDKPVEQVRKNIKVLTGLPNSQLIPLMNFVAVSLGVRCDFCHVTQGKDAQGRTNWVWESDEKEDKRIAREMMRMVLTINKGDFGVASGRVTCYTCHQGKERPTSMPSMPLTVSGHEPGPSPTPAASSEARPAPPTVQQVYDKYVAAVGGAAALEKFQTVVLKGTREASQGRVFPFEATLKAPDKFKMVVEVPRQGQFQQVVAGATGWVGNPRTRRAVGPKELADLKMGAELLGVVKFHPTPTMRVGGGVSKVGDRDAVVVIDRPSENVSRRYFFDAQTGLLLRISTRTETVLMPLPEQIDFEDYRDVSGVKLPFVIRVSAIDTFDSYTRKITEVSPGVAVDDKIFEMPPAPAPTPTPAAAPPGR